jgi:phenylalanine-4-hydroxylase
MSPRLRNQKMWARHLSPSLEFSFEKSSWQILHEFTLPLVRELASSAHREGITRLGLNTGQQPEFTGFRRVVESETGWKIVPASDEWNARDFFALLAQRSFPCVASLRPTTEVFAGSKPDFWHEAVGHLAPLVNREISDFYCWCGETVTHLYQNNQFATARRLEQVLWALLEYGFIKEAGQVRTFGAALSGSFMALQRWRRGYVEAREDWTCEGILNSRLYEEGANLVRNEQGQLSLFLLPHFAETKKRLTQFIDDSKEIP